MDIRWMAVFLGFFADTLISQIIYVIANPDASFQYAPDISHPDHLILIILMTLSTGVGGFVAGRIAKVNVAWHGVLVGVISIFINQLAVMSGDTVPHVYVIMSAIACFVGALGGWLSLIGQKVD